MSRERTAQPSATASEGDARSRRASARGSNNSYVDAECGVRPSFGFEREDPAASPNTRRIFGRSAESLRSSTSTSNTTPITPVYVLSSNDHGSLTVNRVRPVATSRVSPAPPTAILRICASVPTMGQLVRSVRLALPEGSSVSSHPAMHTTPKKPLSGGAAAFASATIWACSGSSRPSISRGSESPGNNTWSYNASTGTRTVRVSGDNEPCSFPLARRSRSTCAAPPPRTSSTSPRYECSVGNVRYARSASRAATRDASSTGDASDISSAPTTRPSGARSRSPASAYSSRRSSSRSPSTYSRASVSVIRSAASRSLNSIPRRSWSSTSEYLIRMAKSASVASLKVIRGRASASSAASPSVPRGVSSTSPTGSASSRSGSPSSI
mmetsp:Transcript_12289/g.51410  ORF Transcript_12289/g.51410 Transcript_12289/m.51410 type:complete len:383 (+) Transcript_12289:814-1962(+)